MLPGLLYSCTTLTKIQIDRIISVFMVQNLMTILDNPVFVIVECAFKYLRNSVFYCTASYYTRLELWAF